MSTTFADVVRASAGRASDADAGRCLIIAEVAQAHDGSLGWCPKTTSCGA